MNTFSKFFLVSSFGLFFVTLVLVGAGKTNATYDAISAGLANSLVRARKSAVLGASITVISITSPGAGSILPAGTASTPLTAATDQVADCKYSGNSGDAFSTMTPFDQTGSTTHSSLLSPLWNGNAYTIYVQCQDGGGSITPKAITYFSVAMPAASATDNTLPIISSIQTVSVSSSSTVISWVTDKPTDAQIEYGPIDAYGSFSPLYDSAVKSTSHTVTVGGLLPNFTYHYRLRSRDASGNLATTPDGTFITLPQSAATWFSSVSMPPLVSSGDFKIYQAYTNYITASSAVIYWTTDAPALGKILYGTTSDYNTSTIATEQLVTSHGMTLQNLIPGTTYHYQILAMDYAGHQGKSGDGWFTTSATSTPTPAVPIGIQPSVPSASITFPTSITTPVPTAETTVKVVLPAKVKDGWVIKFRKSPAVFLVKTDGLHPFDSMTTLNKYRKQSRQSIRTYAGSPAPYTVSPVPAAMVLGYQ